MKINEKEKFDAKRKHFAVMSEMVKVDVRKELQQSMKLDKKTKITKNTVNSRATEHTRKIANIERISLKICKLSLIKNYRTKYGS